MVMAQVCHAIFIGSAQYEIKIAILKSASFKGISPTLFLAQQTKP